MGANLVHFMGVNNMVANLALLQTVANTGGTANVVIPVTAYNASGYSPSGIRSLNVIVAANFGAASTAGLSTVLSYSADGSTYVASLVGFPLTVAAATGPSVNQVVYRLRDHPFKLDGGPIEDVKVTVTNNDTSHDAVVAILWEDEKVAAAQ
jgi:hypothetical protein